MIDYPDDPDCGAGGETERGACLADYEQVTRLDERGGSVTVVSPLDWKKIIMKDVEQIAVQGVVLITLTELSDIEVTLMNPTHHILCTYALTVMMHLPRLAV